MKKIYRSFEKERYLLRPCRRVYSDQYALLIGEDGYAYNGYWENAQI